MPSFGCQMWAGWDRRARVPTANRQLAHRRALLSPAPMMLPMPRKTRSASASVLGRSLVPERSRCCSTVLHNAVAEAAAAAHLD